jgi:hypothetical protein
MIRPGSGSGRTALLKGQLLNSQVATLPDSFRNLAISPPRSFLCHYGLARRKKRFPEGDVIVMLFVPLAVVTV